MALFRNVNLSFWTDSKVVDDYTPEDKYFMLYALTNNYTNIIGCYEISLKQMSNDLGYTKEVIESLLRRFEEKHKTIQYDFETKEMFVVNWSKYNWSNSPKLNPPLYAAIEKVKSDKFHDSLATLYNQRETILKQLEEGKEDVLIPYRYGIDTTITITNTITSSIPITNSNSNTITDTIPYTEIIDYLNLKANTNYRASTKKTQTLIKARFNEGFTLEDFKKVIDTKTAQWLGNKEMEMYLRPETLFGNKFEGYLNQKAKAYTLNDLDIDLTDFYKS